MHRYPTRLQSRLAKPRARLQGVDVSVLNELSHLMHELKYAPLRNRVSVSIKIWRILVCNEVLVQHMHARQPSIVLDRIYHFRQRRREIQEESDAIERAIAELGDLCRPARALLARAWSDRLKALSDFPQLEELMTRVESMCNVPTQLYI